MPAAHCERPPTGIARRTAVCTASKRRGRASKSITERSRAATVTVWRRSLAAEARPAPSF